MPPHETDTKQKIRAGFVQSESSPAPGRQMKTERHHPWTGAVMLKPKGELGRSLERMHIFDQDRGDTLRRFAKKGLAVFPTRGGRQIARKCATKRENPFSHTRRVG